MNDKRPQIGRANAVRSFYKTLFNGKYEKAVEFLPYTHDPNNNRSQYLHKIENIDSSWITINGVSSIAENHITINNKLQSNFNEYAFASILNDKAILPQIFFKRYIDLGESKNSFKLNIQDGVAVTNKVGVRIGRMAVKDFTVKNRNSNTNNLWWNATLNSSHTMTDKQLWENPDSSDVKEAEFIIDQATVDVSNFSPDLYYLFLWGCHTGASEPQYCRWLKPRIFRKTRNSNIFGRFITTLNPIDAYLLKINMDVTTINKNNNTKMGSGSVSGKTVVYRIDDGKWYVGGFLPRYKERIIETTSPPKAKFNYSPKDLVVGKEIMFDGSPSSDSDGKIKRYEWDLNGDGKFEKQGQQVSYSFRNPGNHKIQLKVTDNNGATATTYENILVPANITPRPPTTILSNSSSKYKLQKGEVTKVNIAGKMLYIIKNVPDTDPNRVAVTNKEYDLIDLSTAKDAILVNTWSEIAWPGDWQKEIDKLRHLRKTSNFNKLFGQALDLGWDLEEIFIYLELGDRKTALDATLKVSTDAIKWSMEDVNHPYRDTFQKLTACLQNARTVKGLAKDIESYSNLGDELQQWGEAALMMHDLTTNGSPLSTAWKQMTAKLFSHSGYSNSAAPVLKELNHSNSGSKKIFIAAMKQYAGAMESVVKEKTTIHAITNAYTYIRMPVVKTLQETHMKIVNGNASVGDISLYNAYLLTNYQMSALLFRVASHYWQEISNGPDGIIWDTLDNAQKKADKFERWATNMMETGMLTQDIYGQGLQLVNNTHQHSINAELLNGQGNK